MGTTLATDAELALVRFSPAGGAERIALAQGSRLSCGSVEVRMARPAELLEVRLADGQATVVAGDPAQVRVLTADGGDLLNR